MAGGIHMVDIMAVILAAGEGKRMNSHKAKMIHEVLGKPMIKRVVDSALEAGIEKCTVVVGHCGHQVEECLGKKSSTGANTGTGANTDIVTGAGTCTGTS